MYEHEHFFACPYCGAWISMLLDLTLASQDYVEDCEVCCNPIGVRYEAEDEQMVWFSADSIEQ